jgi:hypothetical protein
MKFKLLAALTLISFQFSVAQITPLPKAVTLPNGWKLSPAGYSFALGDLPLNIAVGNTQR